MKLYKDVLTAAEKVRTFYSLVDKSRQSNIQFMPEDYNMYDIHIS